MIKVIKICNTTKKNIGVVSLKDNSYKIIVVSIVFINLYEC